MGTETRISEWGTLRSTTVAAVSHAIQTTIKDVSVRELTVKQKYKVNPSNVETKCWYIVRGEEQLLQKLESSWRLLYMHTNWKIEHVLKFSEAATTNITEANTSSNAHQQPTPPNVSDPTQTLPSSDHNDNPQSLSAPTSPQLSDGVPFLEEH